MRTRTVCVLALVLAIVAVPAVAAALPSIPSAKFGPSASCGCHAALLGQWQESMHAKALGDPLYQTKLKKANEATAGALGTFCDGCHAPVAVMAGEPTGDSAAVSEVGAEGVTCDFCHQVTGTEGTLGNTSVAITGDGIKRAQLTDPQAPHAAQYSPFHESAEFCGNCHNVDHPVNGMHLEMTYTEWKNGPYAAEGVVCQDCHMTPGPGVTKPNPGKAASMGPDREHIYVMTFAGGNVGLGNAALADANLTAAAELELDLPEIQETGDVALTTTITNVGAGHYLPTGLTEVRQMWLEVTAVDEAGNELLGERRDFGTVLQGADGAAPVELWEAVAIQSDDRIPPRESATNDYTFPMAIGAVTVEATLYYRSCSEEFAAEAGVDIPTTTMARVTKTVYPSAAARDAAEAAEAEAADEADAGGSNNLLWFAAIAAVGAVAAAVVVMRRRKQ